MFTMDPAVIKVNIFNIKNILEIVSNSNEFYEDYWYIMVL